LRKFLGEVVRFFPEFQLDVQNLEELQGNSVVKSEGSSSHSDSARPAARLRNDAAGGGDADPTPPIVH
jgi:hypothetical protein